MDRIALKEIKTDGELDDKTLTMRKHKEADNQEEEMEQGEEIMAQQGSERGKGVHFQVDANEETGMTVKEETGMTIEEATSMTAEEGYEEAIRDATNATPQTPWPSPDIKKDAPVPETANSKTHTNAVSLTEEDYEELDIFWECMPDPSQPPLSSLPKHGLPRHEAHRQRPRQMDKWVRGRLTIPDFLFLKNRQRDSEQAPTRRASISAKKLKRRAEREREFETQTLFGWGTTAPTNGAVSPGMTRLPLGSWSPGLPASSGFSTQTSSGTVTPLSLEDTTPPTRAVKPTRPKLPMSSGSQMRTMSPESLAEFGARARVVIPTSSRPRTPAASGAVTPTSIALRSEGPMSADSGVLDIPDIVDGEEVVAGSRSRKPPKLGVRVWSGGAKQ
ncbi:hypothetical protein EG327_002201 [Venturia inaequalis]|uniref:Uncharacterized protein n=1 Tax=Venturia inaequalis TaxID=5025 RepID=A0A8H3ZB53_VENIN|nr:hypothetical protein EG327_002201 [Venturia inaequalis]